MNCIISKWLIKGNREVMEFVPERPKPLLRTGVLWNEPRGLFEVQFP